MNSLPFRGMFFTLCFAFAANIDLRLLQRQHCVCRKRRLMFAANVKRRPYKPHSAIFGERVNPECNVVIFSY